MRPSRQWGSSGAPFSLRRIDTAGRGARAPNSAVVILRTRQSRPASSKIASAKSAQVQSPPAATCQRPKGCPASTSSRVAAGEVPDVGRAAALVGDDRDLVALGSEPEHRADEVVAGRAEEPRAPDHPGVARRRRPRRAASSSRTPTAGSGCPTRGTARPCGRRRRSRWSRRRSVRRARPRARCRRRSPRPHPAGRPRRRPRSSRPPRAGRGPAAAARRAPGSARPTRPGSARRRRRRQTPPRAPRRAGRPRP